MVVKPKIHYCGRIKRRVWVSRTSKEEVFACRGIPWAAWIIFWESPRASSHYRSPPGQLSQTRNMQRSEGKLNFDREQEVNAICPPRPPGKRNRSCCEWTSCYFLWEGMWRVLLLRYYKSASFPDEGVCGRLISSDEFPQDPVMLNFFLPWLLLYETEMRLSCLQVYGEGWQ